MLAAGIRDSHDVFLTDLPENKGEGNISYSDLNHDKATNELVDGIDALIHIGFEGQCGDATSLIDYHTRRTYNLLQAAVASGVERCLYISTLRLLDNYDEILTVTEQWRSLPPAENSLLLACHLGEIVCKEFARDRLIKVANIRLGFPVIDGGRDAIGLEELAALSSEDACLVVSRALTAEIASWQDVHVQSPMPNQRFLMKCAQSLLKFPEDDDK